VADQKANLAGRSWKKQIHAVEQLRLASQEIKLVGLASI
jgi:hypothetical protein